MKKIMTGILLTLGFVLIASYVYNYYSPYMGNNIEAACNGDSDCRLREYTRLANMQHDQLERQQDRASGF